MATIESFAGNMTDIGPMYPFVGSELLLVVVAGAFWIVWHVLQLRAEQREFEEDAARLRKEDGMRKAIEREGWAGTGARMAREQQRKKCSPPCRRRP